MIEFDCSFVGVRSFVCVGALLARHGGDTADKTDRQTAAPQHRSIDVEGRTKERERAAKEK